VEESLSERMAATQGLHGSHSVTFASHMKLFEVIGDGLNAPEGL
jgi:hypothetical protein